jgi:selenocysteine lyase/cysteine desulfurase
VFDEDIEFSRRGMLGFCGKAIPATAFTLGAVKAAFAQSAREVAGLSAANKADEGYWAKIRERFLLEKGLAYLNNGTVGPTPQPVYDALTHYWKLMAENPNENSAVLQDRSESIREKAARFIGATAGEVAVLRNATEGNNLVCTGLDLKAGDEVLLGSLEHDSNRQPWLLKAKRHGIVVKEAVIGTPPKSTAEIVNAFETAIGPRTRVLAVAHCDTVTGTITPVKQLAALARSKGLFCHVDGAQTLGMGPVDVRDLGVDTYVTTCHKWLCAPAGTGLLYVKRDAQDRIWPNVVTEDWWNFNDARKYDRVSRRPWPVVAALEDTIDLHLAITKPRIEARCRALASYFREQAASIPGVRLYTSNDPALSGAITSLSLDNVAPARLREHLRVRYDVYTAARARGERYPADPHGVDGIRVSTHFYNTFEQVNRVLEGLRELGGKKG